MSRALPIASTRSIFSFLLLYLGLIVISLIPVIVFLTNRGWDAHVFCAAARVASLGGNPYESRELELKLSWNYQPYMLPVFSALCRLNFESLYPILDSFFLLAGVTLWKPKPELLLLALILSLGCFWGFGWVLLSGNITAVEFLLISITLVFFEKGEWDLAGLVLGVMASIKLLTVLYLGLLLFVPLPFARKRRTLLISFASFFATLLISYVLYPNLFQSFLEQVLGLMPNQHNVWIEGAKMNNVPLAYLLIDVLGLFGISFSSAASLLLGVAFSIAIVFWIYGKVKLSELAMNDYLAFFSLGFIAFTLLLPRLKPYSFLMMAPPLFYLTRSQGIRRQNLIVILSTVLPTILFFAQLFMTVNNPVASLLLGYSATILLLVTFAVLVHFVNHPNQTEYARTA